MTTFGQRVAVWSLFGACVEPVWSLCASIDNNERLGSVRAYMYPDRRRRDSSPARLPFCCADLSAFSRRFNINLPAK